MTNQSFYQNTDMIVFGERFTNKAPIQILDHFRGKSFVFRWSEREEYLDHLRLFSDIPDRKKGESDVSYYDRIFDVLRGENIVVLQNEVIH